jgi:hypothetical protein
MLRVGGSEQRMITETVLCEESRFQTRSKDGFGTHKNDSCHCPTLLTLVGKRYLTRKPQYVLLQMA